MGVTLTIPDDVARKLGSTEPSVRLEVAVALYPQGNITLEQARQMVGASDDAFRKGLGKPTSVAHIDRTQEMAWLHEHH